MVSIAEETNLSDADISALADLYSQAFEHDPIGIRCIGVERSVDPKLWKAAFLDNVLQGVQAGSIVLARSEEGKIIAGAICYGPGQLMPDELATNEMKELVAAMPAEQQAFRSKEAIHCRELPLNYVRDNLFVFQFAAAPSHKRQGLGLGSQLLRYLKKTFPHNAIVLDTSKWENVLFYQANGFELKGHFEIEHYRLGPLPKMYMLTWEKSSA